MKQRAEHTVLMVQEWHQMLLCPCILANVLRPPARKPQTACDGTALQVQLLRNHKFLYMYSGKGVRSTSCSEVGKPMYNSALPVQNQQNIKTGSDGGTLDGRSRGRGLLASYHGYDSQAHSSDTDIHAFLASELFGPSLNTGGAEESADPELSQEKLSWERTPGAPESYQTEALKLFGDQVAAEHDDIASASPGQSSGAVAQISLDPDPTQISTGHQRRKDKRKSGSGHKDKKRSTQLHQVYPFSRKVACWGQTPSAIFAKTDLPQYREVLIQFMTS